MNNRQLPSVVVVPLRRNIPAAVARVGPPEQPPLAVELTDVDEDLIDLSNVMLTPPARKVPLSKKRKRPGPVDVRRGGKKLIRFDAAYISSAECTQVCLDNQSAMDAYRRTAKCPICLDVFKDLTSTSCGHVFCRECIRNAILVSQKCPLCQKKTLMQNLHALHL
jgi:hypothetical protein